MKCASKRKQFFFSFAIYTNINKQPDILQAPKLYDIHAANLWPVLSSIHISTKGAMKKKTAELTPSIVPHRVRNLALKKTTSYAAIIAKWIATIITQPTLKQQNALKHTPHLTLSVSYENTCWYTTQMLLSKYAHSSKHLKKIFFHLNSPKISQSLFTKYMQITYCFGNI